MVDPIKVAILEPLRMSIWSYISTKRFPNADIWDWLIPIEQPIRIQQLGHSEKQSRDETIRQQRIYDDRYRPGRGPYKVLKSIKLRRDLF